jgi:multidrug efflux pump subunit AcrA (membrane-fusion protein)
MLVLQNLAKAGARVAKGDVVAEFDRQDAINRLDDFRVRVAQADASIKSLKAQLEVIRKAHQQSVEKSKGEWEKARIDLKSIPVRSANAAEMLRLADEEAEAAHKQLLDEVRLMEQSLAAQIKFAELVRAEAAIEMRRVQSNVDRMLIKAPIDGLVVMQTMWRGGEQSQIQEGDQVFPGQAFMRIVDPGSMLVNATVNQVDAEKIRIGASARVSFDAYPDLTLPARVYAMGAMPTTSGFRATYVKEIPVTLKLERTDPRVIPDLSAHVDVVLETAPDSVVVPLEAVFRDGSGSFVYVRTSSGWERRPIELGLTNYVLAAVRSGLKPGEMIATARLLPESRTR